jgi:hypothetical protein
MRFVVEMDDDQYSRLEKILEKSGTTLTEAIKIGRASCRERVSLCV